ncbi:PfkB family carbohydrate kinase [Niabella aurantiaca]|uniref:PfkB family carbohydrate kinase n=1 Tax=Niabella aurantiaca TaxID=379900 RepID=UPI00037EA9CC|nr:PfkB family carbohydrate kinase [Niabella aurantiaca]
MRKKKVICFGEVLWDHLVTGRQIGGAPLNVCYHLSKTGIDSRIISQVGADKNGFALLEKINDLGIDARYCKLSAQHPTSTVEVLLSGDKKIVYDIVDRVAWDFIETDHTVIEDLKTAAAFIYGSLAARNAVSRNTLQTYLGQTPWPVFDINLREPFYDPGLITQLLSYSKTLKLNDEEVCILSAWFASGDDERQVINYLFQNFCRLEEVIVTKGAEGVSYYASQFELHLAAMPVNVVDTVGSGDSFLVAFIARKLLGASIDTCLKEAIVLSAFVATKNGGTPPYQQDDLDGIRSAQNSSSSNLA